MPLLQRPAYLGGAPAVSVAAKLAAGLGAAQPPRISLEDDRFTCLTAQGDKDPRVQPALTLDVIFIGSNEHPSRMYYDAAYDRNDAAAPVCWSDNGVAPSAQSSTPQSQRCDTCPQAVWGSKISANGSKIPACTTKKKVAVMVGGCGDTVFLLAVPPNSLKVLRDYVNHLAKLPAEPYEVVTQLSMENKTLGFDVLDWVPEAAAPMVLKMLESDEIDVVVGAKDKPIGAQAALSARETPRQITTSPENRQEAPAPVANGFGGAPTPAAQQAPNGFAAPAPAPVETPEQREAREFAEWKAGKAAQAAPSTGGEPAKRTRGPNKPKETVVGPGPIAANAFAGAQSFVPPQAPGAANAFGMNGSPQPAPQNMEAILAAALGRTAQKADDDIPF